MKAEILMYYARIQRLMVNVETIKMTQGNRMLRIGLGQHDHKWFVRLDLWWLGVRLSC